MSKLEKTFIITESQLKILEKISTKMNKGVPHTLIMNDSLINFKYFISTMWSEGRSIDAILTGVKECPAKWLKRESE